MIDQGLSGQHQLALSPVEMNRDQMRSSYEVGSWVIGDTSWREGRDGNEDASDDTS